MKFPNPARCQHCGAQTGVNNKRDGKYGIWRRRFCLACGERFTTAEMPVECVEELLAAKNSADALSAVAAKFLAALQKHSAR